MTTPENDEANTISRRKLLQWSAAGIGAGVLGAALPDAATRASVPLLRSSVARSLAKEKTLSALRIGVSSMPTNMDPSFTPGNASVAIHWNVFDTLIWADQSNKYKLRPGLASAWHRVNNRTLDVTVNSKVRFHDGTRLSPDDVAFSFNRILTTTNASYSLSQSLLNSLASVQVIGGNKVRFTAKADDPILEYRLASVWGSWVIPQGYYEQVGLTAFQQKPVGTGPYRVASFSPSQLVLERFDGFWGPRPAADQITYTLYVEDDTRISALFTGEIDIAGQIPPDQLTSVATRPGFYQKSVVLENMHLHTYNASAAGMEDPNLRKALSLGIDRKLLVNTLWGTHAQLDRGHQYPQYEKMFIQNYPYYDRNVAQATQLVKNSSYKGETLRYEYVPGGYVNAAQTAQAIVSMWQQIGINAQVAPVQKATYSQIGTWSNSMRFPDPLGGLWLLWSPTAGDIWWKGDPQFTAIGTQMQSTMDNARRKVLAGELMKSWDTVIPGTALWYPFYTWGIRNGLKWDPYPSLTMDFRAESFKVL